MELGLTEIEAVGAAGGGGAGGGGAGAFFFAQAPSIMTAPKVTTRNNNLMRCCFTVSLPTIQRLCWVRRSVLFPTPVRLRIVSTKSQLLHFRAVGQHRPDLQAARTVRLKDDVPPIRRPRREIVPPAIMGELHPLFAGHIH